MNKTRILTALLCMAALSMAMGGIAVGKGTYLNRLTDDQMQSQVDSSPMIYQKGKHLAELPPDAVVEIYFKKFNLITMPSPKDEFLMGEGSSPPWKSRHLAEVTIYRFERSDPSVLEELKKIAASMGGTALINVERAPVLRRGSLQISGQDWRYDIMGYAYYADVVVKR